MKSISMLTPAAFFLFAGLGTPAFSDHNDMDKHEKNIQLSEVPQAAMDAARKALGTSPTEAKIISGTTPQEYELEARNKSGKEIGVNVSADGKVLKKAHDEEAEHGEHGAH
jgi:hypothetical protein